MQASKRGQKVAAAGLVLQLALVALMVALRHVSGSVATYPAMWLLIAPLGLWVMTLLLFYCRWLQRREVEELERLSARPGRAESIFKGEAEQVRAAANRLRWMQRYLVPAFTLVFAACHVAAGLLLLRWVRAIQTDLPAVGAPAAVFFAFGGAFLAFIFSRYVTGMAEGANWRLLRAPGSYLFANAVTFVLVAGVLAADYYKLPAFGQVVAYAFPIFAIVVGAELTLNFVLDIYRPRMPGREVRYSYDSRLLDLMAKPESLGHSIAEALNYQFGFEVSSTWFYQLLRRVLAPLLLVGVLIIWLMTSVVIVPQGQQYVVMRLGKAEPRRLLKPRALPYLIRPWPIDTARKFDTGKLHRISLGMGGDELEKFIEEKSHIWSIGKVELEEGATGEHSGHLDVLVPMETNRGDRRVEAAPSVGILKMIVLVYYRIEDPYKFGYTAVDAPGLLKALSYRELIDYAASASTGGQARRPGSQAIMGFSRDAAATALKRRIARAADKLDLGVRIASVEMMDCHPPGETAWAFEEVLAAELRQDKYRYQAQAEANRMLAAVAGDPDEAVRLAHAITVLQELQAMAKIRRDNGDVGSAVTEAIARTRQEMEAVGRQFRVGETPWSQKWLAPFPESPEAPGARDESTGPEELFQRHKSYLALLAKIQADPAGFDFAAETARARGVVDDMFKRVQGQAAVTISKARAQRWKTEFRERARGQTFEVDLLGFRAAPSLYRLDKYLNVLAESMKKRRKYVLGIDRDAVEIRLNLRQDASATTDIPLGEKQE